MKKLTLILLVTLFAYGAGHGQCNVYYDIKEGTLIEMLSFTAKDKQEGRTVTKVTSYTPTSDGFEAVINSSFFDKKNKEAHNGDLQMSCRNGVLLVDMKRFIPEESLKSMQDAEMEITGDFLELPGNLNVGQTLKDGFIEIKMSTGQPVGMSININIKDRKVEAKETITTPAGSFDCYKISYTISSRTNMMGININNVMKNEEWVSEGIGVVKTSSYNSRGGLTGYTLLSKYEK